MAKDRDSGEQMMVVALPRWTPWAKRGALGLVALWLLYVVWERVLDASSAARALDLLALDPAGILHGRRLWTPLTYGLLETSSSWGAVWMGLTLWLLGSPIERARSGRTLLEASVAGQLVGAVLAVLVALVWPAVYATRALGTGPASGALLLVWAWLLGSVPQNFFGLAQLTGRQLALGLGGLTVALGLYSRSAGGIAAIGGLLGGALYIAWLSRRRRKPPPAEPRLRVLAGGRGNDLLN